MIPPIPLATIAPVRVADLGILGEVRVGDRLARRDERELREAVHPARVLPADQASASKSLTSAAMCVVQLRGS